MFVICDTVANVTNLYTYIFSTLLNSQAVCVRVCVVNEWLFKAVLTLVIK